MKMARGIYLVGFSGSGKSTIARLIGEKLDWPACDLDDLIVQRVGLTIPEIFQREGEDGFRSREAEALRDASSNDSFVVATGGGTVVRSENRAFMTRKGWIICLDAQPQTVLTRIQRQLKRAEVNAIRPLLDAVYPLDQIRALKHARQSAYGLADWTIHTDRLTEEQVATEVIRAADMLENSNDPPAADSDELLRHSLNPELPPPIVVAAGPWPYQVVVGWNHLNSFGEHVHRILPRSHRAAIFADSDTWRRLGNVVTASLTGVGFEINVREVPHDESIKTPDEVSAVHDWLLGIKFRRDDVFVIVGSGAVDDLGGFAASTYMRGVALVKIPTSLDGMVDSSIGGKTALNHPRARNLIGTFFHPRLIWSDASLLREEPEKELGAAWAEVIKYAMLESSLLRHQEVGVSLFDQLKENSGQLIKLEKKTLLSVLARCVALKAQVVAGDELDVGQYRILLNYGHTIGHALETATDYKLLHGEAVAIGMTIEAGLSVRLGLASPEVEMDQNELLQRFGLPTRLPKVSRELLLSLINSDKKVFGNSPRWILPVAVGRAVVSSAVTEADLIDVLDKYSS
jgi:shikimate kinase/3-dehydroquinate synthase